MEFYEKLNELRRKKGISQEELANMLHLSRQAVSKWETNQSYPDSKNLIELSRIFDVSVDELLGLPVRCAMSQDNFIPEPQYFEYKSKAHIGSLPLVHVVCRKRRRYYGYYGGKIKVAKGIIAIGEAAIGVIAIGLFNIGIFSIGIIGIGLALGLNMIGIGLYAMGLISLGYSTFGVLSVGFYSFGVIAVALKVAVGVAAISQGVAIGVLAHAPMAFPMDESGNHLLASAQEIHTALQMFPHCPDWLLKMISLFIA